MEVGAMDINLQVIIPHQPKPTLWSSRGHNKAIRHVKPSIKMSGFDF
jgi:hypothetical protein